MGKLITTPGGVHSLPGTTKKINMNETEILKEMNDNLLEISRTLQSLNLNLYKITESLDSIDRYGVSMISDPIQSTTNNKNAF